MVNIPDFYAEADRIAAANEAALLAQYETALRSAKQQVSDLRANTEALKIAKPGGRNITA